MTTFAPTAARLSEVSQCPRKAAYRILGAEAAPVDPVSERYFRRGHLYTRYVTDQLIAKHGRDDVESEKEVSWPLGTGHIDAFIKSQGLVVEIKSSVTPTMSTPMFDMSVEQNKLYQHYTPEAKAGAVYIINPSDLTGEDVFQVVVTDEDRERIEETVASVVTAAEGGPLPDRVCSRPSQARGRFCPFAAVCFPDWQPDPAEEITSPEALDAVSRLYAIKEEKRQHSAAIKALEEGERQAQAELADHVEPGEALVGGFAVKRTHVVLSPKFSERAAKAAGFPVETLAEFYAGGSEHDRWTITRTDERGSTDFGDEAPY